MLFDFDFLFDRHKLKINGILHIGAHLAEEAIKYDSISTDVLWVEGNPNLIDSIKKVLEAYENQRVVNVLVSDVSGESVKFNISNDTQASSVLLPGEIKYYHKNITNESVLQLETQRLDDYFDTNLVEKGNFNFINLDIQGLELHALKGLGKYLNDIEYIYTEVNLIEIYKGVPLLHKMDLFLKKKGFIRKELKLTPMGWGDAFYVRSNVSFLKITHLVAQALYLEIFYKVKTIAKKIIQG